MYTIITPTGNRQKSFNFLSRLIIRQTIQPKEWIVVDDGIPPTTTYPISFLNYIHRDKKPNEVPHTICLNMLEAINQITTKYIFIFEDDDYYAEDYVENLLPLLDKYDIVGGRPTLHYNIQNRQYKYYDTGRLKTCLCRTAFNSTILPIFKEVCVENHPCIDINLWKYAVERGYKGYIRNDDKLQHIGFKGLQGRSGAIGMHARALVSNPTFTKDPDYKKLKELVGRDFDEYMRMI